MMRRLSSTLAIAVAAFALANPVYGQPAPFDMSEDIVSPEPRVLPLGLSPGGMPPLSQPILGLEIAKQFFLPKGENRLVGELAAHDWTLTLPPGSLESAQLHLGYRNSVMVAPESSRMQIAVNGTILGETTIRSSAGPTDLVIPVPVGLLKEGQNQISVEARQRHRTDCTVESTYELWTDLDPNRTFLSHSKEGNAFPSKLQDLPAIGMDGDGQTRVEIIAPGIEKPIMAEALLVFAQKLAVMTNAPHMTFSVSRSIKRARDEGTLTVLFGTYSELELLGVSSPEPSQFVFLEALPERPAHGRTVLVLGGATPEELGENADSWPISDLGQKPENVLMWPGTDVPLIASGGSISFGELGVPTERFSGRRYSREFDIAVPTDFYAQSYGEAKIMLDAAISREVRPGSRIDIYVNERIASTVPIMDSGGGVLRQLPIRVGLKDIRPGKNRIRLDAVMVTDADLACEPGTTASDTPRFALYDTSRFSMPDFARIAQRPNLAAFASGEIASEEQNDGLSIVLNLQNEQTIAAAMNLTGRIAAASGQVRSVSLISSQEAKEVGSALIIAPIAHLPASVRDHVRISPPQESGWASEKTVNLSLGREQSSELDEWRESLETSPVRRRLRGLASTLQENFDLSLAALRLVPGKADFFSPEASDTLLVSQSINPHGNGIWTVISAATPESLLQGSIDLSDRGNWSRIGGRLSIYSAEKGTVVTLPPIAIELVPTQPWSFANARLIATNWLSSNALAYSLILSLACILLGAVTLALLSQLGRRS